MINKIKQFIQHRKVQKTLNDDLDESRFPPPNPGNIDYYYPKYKVTISQSEIDMLQVCINNRMNLQELIEYGNGKRI